MKLILVIMVSSLMVKEQSILKLILKTIKLKVIIMVFMLPMAL